MSLLPAVSEPSPAEKSELRLSTPACRHEHYERLIEDPRFARAQCLRCPHSWVEIDISPDRAFTGRGRFPRIMSARDEEGLDGFAGPPDSPWPP